MTVIPQSGILTTLTVESLTLVRLSDLIETYRPETLANLLSSFRCERNKDVESFLHDNALLFERAGKSRTYLVVTTSSFKSPTSVLEVTGYFTLALTHQHLNSELSKTLRKKLHGLFLPDNDIVVGYLIGQLAKGDAYRQNLSGALLIEFAIGLVRMAREHVGGRFVLVECANEDKLLAFYQKYDFVFVQNNSEDAMVQLAYFL